MNNIWFDFYYSVIKNRDEKDIVKDEYEYNENDKINFDNFLTPNQYIGRKLIIRY